MVRRVLRWGNGAYNCSPEEVGKRDKVDWIHVTDEETGLHVHITDEGTITNYGDRKLSRKERVIMEDVAKQTNWKEMKND